LPGSAKLFLNLWAIIVKDLFSHTLWKESLLYAQENYKVELYLQEGIWFCASDTPRINTHDRAIRNRRTRWE
jgi:hypothetical protein